MDIQTRLACVIGGVAIGLLRLHPLHTAMAVFSVPRHTEQLPDRMWSPSQSVVEWEL